MFHQSDQNLEAKNAPRQNISFNWMGANYLMENNEEHHHDLGGNKGSERKMFETGCNARKDSNEDSNGITLNQGLKQFVVSPTNASYSCNADSHLVEHNFMHEKENKATCFESTSHNEEFDSAPELASIQSEFEAVLNASQVEVDLPLSSELHNKGYKRSENGLSVHCSDISNLNKFEGRNLVVEPLCKPRSGKCDILAFVLQVSRSHKVYHFPLKLTMLATQALKGCSTSGASGFYRQRKQNQAIKRTALRKIGLINEFI